LVAASGVRLSLRLSVCLVAINMCPGQTDYHPKPVTTYGDFPLTFVRQFSIEANYNLKIAVSSSASDITLALLTLDVDLCSIPVLDRPAREREREKE